MSKAKRAYGFPAPTTTEKLQEPCGNRHQRRQQSAGFFIADYRSPEERPYCLPHDLVLSADMDELNFLAARLEKLDAAALAELNAALTKIQERLFKVSGRSPTTPTTWTSMCICRMSKARASWGTIT